MAGTPETPGDDPWDGVVFDEAFIRGGRHEPPARTRESIARYGGQRTSWRQGALFEPVPAKRRRRRGRWSRHGLLLAVAAVVAAALTLFVFTRVSPAPDIAAVVVPPAEPLIPGAAGVAASSPTSAGPAAADRADPTDVYGVTELDPVGTCYLDPQTNGSTLQLSTVDCTAEHNLELVSHRTATGDDATYPGEDYWDQVVGQACTEDLTGNLGVPRSAWPAGVTATSIIPQDVGWAFGERHVYCMVHVDAMVTANLLH